MAIQTDLVNAFFVTLAAPFFFSSFLGLCDIQPLARGRPHLSLATNIHTHAHTQVVLLACTVALTAAACYWALSRRRVFLVDFAVYRAPQEMETSPE